MIRQFWKILEADKAGISQHIIIIKITNNTCEAIPKYARIIIRDDFQEAFLSNIHFFFFDVFTIVHFIHPLHNAFNFLNTPSTRQKKTKTIGKENAEEMSC
jgi:hypothetical protein